MPTEIERKFLVLTDEWRTSVSRFRRLKQGYLFRSAQGSLRVRRWNGGGTITVKGLRHGIARAEFEYEIPLDEADEMLASLCDRPLIEKIRYWVEHAGTTWLVDVYCGAVKGLVLAEIELDRVDQVFAVPRWIGAEVTHDPAYRSVAIEALITGVSLMRAARHRTDAVDDLPPGPAPRLGPSPTSGPSSAPHGR
jgi:CYTH domain-containing protein